MSVLLDDVDQYGKEVIVPLLHDVITGDRAGHRGRSRSPWSSATPKDRARTVCSSTPRKTIGAREVELKPFDEKADEDLLAYEQVLLSPDEKDGAGESNTPSFLRRRRRRRSRGRWQVMPFNHRATQEVRAEWVETFRQFVGGIPGRMSDRPGISTLPRRAGNELSGPR